MTSRGGIISPNLDVRATCHEPGNRLRRGLRPPEQLPARARGCPPALQPWRPPGASTVVRPSRFVLAKARTMICVARLGSPYIACSSAALGDHLGLHPLWLCPAAASCVLARVPSARDEPAPSQCQMRGRAMSLSLLLRCSRPGPPRPRDAAASWFPRAISANARFSRLMPSCLRWPRCRLRRAVSCKRLAQRVQAPRLRMPRPSGLPPAQSRPARISAGRQLEARGRAHLRGHAADAQVQPVQGAREAEGLCPRPELRRPFLGPRVNCHGLVVPAGGRVQPAAR